MIAGFGSDVVEIERIARMYNKFGLRFVERVFIGEELKCIGSSNCIERLAVRFAAKEAFVKALGTGFRDCSWRDIEVYSNELGKPHLRLHNNVAYIHQKYTIHLTLSHTQNTAFAAVILETQ